MGVTTERLLIEGPTGVLEAMLELPPDVEAGAAVPGVALICHPHPQFQGTMLNKVVHTLSRSATDCGLPALRFNYRAVGKSAGVYDEGRGETDDAQAAADYVQSRFPPCPLLLAGFSFGAGVVLRLAERVAPAALIAAAPPVGRLGVPDPIGFTCPWQVIQGSADELVDAQQVQTWAQAQDPAPNWVLMDQVSHFFHGNLTSLRREARAFTSTTLSLPPIGDD